MGKAETQFKPDYIVPPGVTLKETLEHMGITQAELAKRTGRPKKTINEIIKGKAAITPETAIQLERVLGVPANFWNNLEKNYQILLAQKEEEEALKKGITWLKQFPLREMVKRNWIKEYAYDKTKQLKEVLNFFGVASIEAFHRVWDKDLASVAYRKTNAYESNKMAIAAWLRAGEIQARQINCMAFKLDRFKEALKKIRPLTRETYNVALPEMVQLCAEAGVAVVFIPEIGGCRLFGATKWLNPSKALIQLSFRYKKDDHFWFTFFHEAGHIILHGKRGVFIETGNDPGSAVKDTEAEANSFAEEYLIPRSKLDNFIAKSKHIKPRDVEEFAEKMGIAPGIVVGQLQHKGIIDFSRLNDLKRDLHWEQVKDFFAAKESVPT